MRNTNFLKTLVVAVCLCIGYAANASIYPYNDFKIEKKSSESEYQEYVGKAIVFYEPVTSKERNFKLDRITFGVPYTIESITVKGYSYDAIVTFAVKKVGNPKAKVVKFKCENGVAASWDASVYDIPAYLTDKMQEFKDKYIGKKLDVSGKECTISDIIMESKYFSEISETHMASTFVYLDNDGNVIKEDTYTALKGGYRSELSRVEKPADESVRYGETSTIQEEGVTKYSYVDNVIDILIFGDKEQFSFVLKNVSDNSIKVVWNEAVFVGMSGSTSKVMHSGIKYSQREGDQPASVIIRGAKLEDIAAPTELIYYSDLLKKWTSKSMYPSKSGLDGQVSLMLPIQIKETINEYIFVFDVVYKYNRPELH